MDTSFDKKGFQINCYGSKTAVYKPNEQSINFKFIPHSVTNDSNLILKLDLDSSSGSYYSALKSDCYNELNIYSSEKNLTLYAEPYQD